MIKFLRWCIDLVSIIILPFCGSRRQVLCYHMVGERLYNSVTPEAFEKQMDNLNNAVPTFDDGTIDSYTEVLPVLVKKGLTGIFFITAGWIGKPGYLSESQVKEMADLGMQIGSHSVTHPDLDKEKADIVLFELMESKRVLEKITGNPVTEFAYPYGKCTKRTAGLMSRAGYTLAYTTAGFGGFRRTVVEDDDSLGRFKRKVRGAYDWWYGGLLPLLSEGLIGKILKV